MTLESRLACLERSHRRWRASALALLAAILAGAGQADPVRDTITARAVRIVDAEGTERIRLGMAEDAAVLSLNDEQGQTRALLYGVGESFQLRFSTTENQPLVRIGVKADDPSITLMDRRGTIRFQAPR
jgi:hypothetical protein